MTVSALTALTDTFGNTVYIRPESISYLKSSPSGGTIIFMSNSSSIDVLEPVSTVEYWMEFNAIGQANRLGQLFQFHHEYTIPAGQKAWMEWRTGSKNVYGVSKLLQSSGGITHRLWKDATFTAGTTEVLMPPQSLNQATPAVSATKIYSNPTSVVTTSATAFSYETLLDAGNKTPVISATMGGVARYLLPNTSYLAEFYNYGANEITVSYDGGFFEVVPSIAN